mmetsp:Transcript_10252/g.21525  ORF Transcript_10252/g.21525 Transcript_10252/m.21525 type:complete len:282 (+) Transcript_10252:1795-2640(+)
MHCSRAELNLRESLRDARHARLQQTVHDSIFHSLPRRVHAGVQRSHAHVAIARHQTVPLVLHAVDVHRFLRALHTIARAQLHHRHQRTIPSNHVPLRRARQHRPVAQHLCKRRLVVHLKPGVIRAHPLCVHAHRRWHRRRCWRRCRGLSWRGGRRWSRRWSGSKRLSVHALRRLVRSNRASRRLEKHICVIRLERQNIKQVQIRCHGDRHADRPVPILEVGRTVVLPRVSRHHPAEKLRRDRDIVRGKQPEREVGRKQVLLEESKHRCLDLVRGRLIQTAV